MMVVIARSASVSCAIVMISRRALGGVCGFNVRRAGVIAGIFVISACQAGVISGVIMYVLCIVMCVLLCS